MGRTTVRIEVTVERPALLPYTTSSAHRGEKRLIFCEARAQAEDLAFELRARGVTTFVSHSSLSADERRQSERAFAEARDCAIVATSTLELGIDIGDLDRVIQIDAPRTVASFLQRLGRTGRRPGSVRNTLVLATEPEPFLRAAGLLLLWGRGFVEPITPPPSPRHIAAQQLLALALQEGQFGVSTWQEWWGTLPVMADGAAVLEYLRVEGFLVEDSGLLFIGPRAEKEFGRRYFMELLSSFTADLELRVVAGRREIGSVSPLALSGHKAGAEKLLLLAGHAWRVEAIDWERHEVLVSEQPEKGKVRWPSQPIPDLFELVRAEREVLLGADPEVELSARAVQRLAMLRDELAGTVADDGPVLIEGESGTVLWTWAGLRANETLLAALGPVGEVSADNMSVRLPPGVGVAAIRAANVGTALPLVSPQAVEGLKFSAALPLEMATATLAERFVDRPGAADVVGSRIVLGSVRGAE